MHRRNFQLLAALIALLVIAGGCSSYRAYRQAQQAATTGDWDQAVLFYMQAVEKDPSNITYRSELLRAKVKASQSHYEKARRYQESGVLDRALIEYQQAVQLDPSNQSAMVELDKVRDALAAESDQRRLDSSIEELKRRTRERGQPPTFNPRSNTPIDLDFPEPVPIKNIYRALGKAFGINVIFDPALKDQNIAIELKQVTAQDALEILMRAGGHFYKVQDETTIIIAADTPQNRRNYEDLVIKTFFLSNAEVKDVVTMLRSLIDARKIATNEQLNAIILRDTADKVKVAERIIEANDKARAEVVVDVELLQINTTKLRELGVNWPGTISATIDTGDDSGSIRLSDVEFLDQNDWTLSLPSFVYNFVKTNTDAQLLAKPQLRISEGETASLVIGDRVPIPVTSFNTSNTVGGNVVPITSFQYQNVGIQISIEPRVHHNKEVTLKVRVEVSTLSGEVVTGGQSQPIIGTRTIESTIRLKDGETNFLAGLIRTDNSVSESGVPGLSDIPIIGRLFSNNRNNQQRTDVILTLTPRIIRSADITEEDLLPIWVGTESNITFRGGSPRVESDVDGPFDGAGQRDAEQIRELIQRRIQRLPRGLRSQAGEGLDEGEGEAAGEPEPPPGIELAPGGAPEDIFDRPEEEEPPEDDGFGVPPDTAAAEPPPEEDDDLFSDDPASFTSRFASWDSSVLPAADVLLPVVPRSAGGFGLGPAARGRIVTAAATAPVRLRLVPADPRVARGESFEVTLEVDARRPISHLPVTLRFDPELLALEKVENGGFLGPEGTAQLLADTPRAGELVLGASRLGAVEGVRGEGTAVRITFRARREGRAKVTFEEGRALDAGLGEVPVEARGAEVEVGPADGPLVPRPPRPELDRPPVSV